jgi:hypothetical protein
MGKEAYLPVPVSRVGVSHKAVFYPELRFPHIYFGSSFFLTDADRQYLSHDSLLRSFP